MNQNQPSKKKTTIIAIAVIVIAIVAYLYVEGGSSPSGSSSLLQGTDTSGVGASEVSLLNQIKSLRMDTTLFSDPAYLSLKDYSVAITPQNVGRADPFSPFPGDPTASSGSGKTK